MACANASARALNELRERYSLEVSSPGVERPLTKPAHFRRFVGRRVRVRTRTSNAGLATARGAGRVASAAGRARRRDRSRDVRTPKSLIGELVGASEREVTLAADGGVVTIPYTEIRRSNLVEE